MLFETLYGNSLTGEIVKRLSGCELHAEEKESCSSISQETDSANLRPSTPQRRGKKFSNSALF